MVAPFRENLIQNIIDAFSHENWEIREKAVSAAVAIRDPEVIEPLLKLAIDDPNDRDRKSVV